ncbi:hypothetical protein HN371_09170 [Candidatus Poribacteria bacterium]|jgi:hypothetical protein|nr:hypothetical protein [Candidatus Poribacteria bacterium]MBT5711931.1 hypothetical protein [Candidatus Poribacteria bacterium]MBT7099842.1 hypothetical protein [Candidatus Poribacteria bacterium]MBT7804463.1 hypothetical protein [Candidatus Poribacteria bacterium]
MVRLLRLRGLDPDLKRSHLPFYLRGRWLAAQAGLAILANFLWALFTIQSRANYPMYLKLSVAVFACATSVGYLYARLGSRFLGVSLLRIRQGAEHALDSRLGKMTLGSGIAVVALPQIASAFIAAELLLFVPFYSGAVVGMALSFFVWAMGLPR